MSWADASVIGVKLVQTGTKKLPIILYVETYFPLAINILSVFVVWARELRLLGT